MLNYKNMCRPLTELLQKDSFERNKKDDLTFEAVKIIMTNTHVLALSDYTWEFTVKKDADLCGIGAV